MNNPNRNNKTMANYYATARSNYFAVKDEKAFREWAARLGLTVVEDAVRGKSAKGIRRFGISPGNRDGGGGWPFNVRNEETGGYDFVVVAEQLSGHLADDEVAVLVEVRYNDLRYVTGLAEAVNNKGNAEFVSLDSIYTAARRLGKNITRAEY